MDSIIPALLYVYGAALLVMCVSPQGPWLGRLLTASLLLRFAATGLRTTVGSDIEAYTALLTECDFSPINQLELAWQVLCIPSARLGAFPFFFVAVIDCALFVVVARLGGWRLAALHDLIYLPSSSMGAIRQALAMKIILITVLWLMRARRTEPQRMSTLIFATPLVHLAAAVPAATLGLAAGGWLVRLMIVAAITVVGILALEVIDEALIEKLFFYFEFEGVRSELNIYASWVKRFFVVAGTLIFAVVSWRVWGLYGIGLLLALSEFKVPEIAVRIGAYFEQFEVMLLAAPLRRNWRKVGWLWYALVGLAYTARYMVNVTALPR
jgi:EpsG family